MRRRHDAITKCGLVHGDVRPEDDGDSTALPVASATHHKATHRQTARLGMVALDAEDEKPGRDHLWRHFAQHSRAGLSVPVMVRGEGAYVFDSSGKRYLDGLSGLFTTQLGYGRTDLVDAAAAQASAMPYFPLWAHAHPPAIELAERLAHEAPSDLNRVFFTSGGSEAVESAWKLAKQYFKLMGKPDKHKVISRSLAYHGTTHGALAITGLPAIKEPFGPPVPMTRHVTATDSYHAGPQFADEEAFGRWAADQIDAAILEEGPDTVAAVFLEPVQNAGGCLVPPPGYFARVRAICDRHDVLLVSDEVICAFGRLGHVFGSQRFDYVPDIITCAKGMTSGYAALGAMIATDRIFNVFADRQAAFAHGYTFGGHPVAAAVSLATLDAFDREGVLDHVRRQEVPFRRTLEGLLDLPIVGDVRGAGYFFAVELVKDARTRETFAPAESERLVRGLAPALVQAGLHCRADNRGNPVIQLAPPLICDQSHFDEMYDILRSVLADVPTWA